MVKKINVLNLYAGIGGNRKLWKDVEVTAVENNPEIAKIYQDFFPEDKVIIGDAHQYLLEHYKEFDFIWSSPPCPSHSQVRYRLGYLTRNIKALFPDMKLYEEIIFLKYFFKGKWVVENVESYYKPLIIPQFIQRHYFWSNFYISKLDLDKDNISGGTVEHFEKRYNFDLSKYNLTKGEKKVILRNCVHPNLGLHIINQIYLKQNVQNSLFTKW